MRPGDLGMHLTLLDSQALIGQLSYSRKVPERLVAMDDDDDDLLEIPKTNPADDLAARVLRWLSLLSGLALFVWAIALVFG
jgi:hypothetical protein